MLLVGLLLPRSFYGHRVRPSRVSYSYVTTLSRVRSTVAVQSESPIEIQKLGYEYNFGGPLTCALRPGEEVGHTRHVRAADS
ncbi:hypothetical protein EVAR_17957_1 [Eumeta japonica]|uniref:Uncharacterized protein n=1 Tax=Eumeta variegata TaxID=151549 RepID=A0A4C1UZM8_EUMVA|nr:hypothetical protein EVAR_17957_1 [Eumeta japonica]